MSAMGVNVVWSLSTYRQFGFGTLALGAALAGVMNFAVLAEFLRRQLGGLRGHGLGLTLAKTVAVTVPMGLAAWSVHFGCAHLFGSEPFMARCAGVFLPITVSLSVWIGVSRALGMAEAHDVIATAKKVLSRG